MSVPEKFPRAQSAISDIRITAANAGLTAKEFDETILPHLDRLVQMKITTPSQRGNEAGYDVDFIVDEKELDILLAPWRPLDISTLIAVEHRLKKFRADWARTSDMEPRLLGIDATLTHLAHIIRKESEKQ